MSSTDSHRENNAWPMRERRVSTRVKGAGHLHAGQDSETGAHTLQGVAR